MVAVFQSPADKIRNYAGRQEPPFPIIADPDRGLYKAYGVETSWTGMARAVVVRFPDLIRAILAEGFLPGTIEGEVQRLPADFLIAPDGRVQCAYYGRDIGDHLPLESLERELASGSMGSGSMDRPADE
jgi:peroxiredoxin